MEQHLMEKITIAVDPENWGNLITKYQPHSPKLDETDFTDGTINLDTASNGALAKRKGGPNYNATLLPGAPKDQHEAIFSDGARHLLVVSNGELRYSSGDTVFNAAVNGTGFSATGNFEMATTQDRVYMCNGINPAQVYDRNTTYGGATPVTAPRLKVMGAQVPVTAPTAAVAAGGAVPVGGHTYKVTYVYYGGEESNPGPASTLATTTGGNQTINLTAIPVGGYGVTQRNIYRDNNDGNYLLLASIANNTATTYSDILTIGPIPTPIPSNNNLPPSFGLIQAWLERLWLAKVPGDPSVLFYSEAGMPDIYGSENAVMCNEEDPITALVVYFDRMMVFNRRSMGQILGDTPDTFRYAKIPSSVGCVDNRTLQTRVVEGVPVLIWLSDRGFYTYDGNAVNYISDWIEDLVNYNIQQALQQKNSNSQTSFSSAFPTLGIDTTQLSSVVTTMGYQDGANVLGNNPRRNFDDSSDWNDSGAIPGGTATLDNGGVLSHPTVFLTSASASTLSGDAVMSGSFAQLPTSSIWTGESKSGPATQIANIGGQFSPIHSIATPFSVPRAGTLDSFSFPLKMAGDAFSIGSSYPYTSPVLVEIYGDAGGQPGGILSTTSTTVTFTGLNVETPIVCASAPNLAVVPGTIYWFVITLVAPGGTGFTRFGITNMQETSSQYNAAGANSLARQTGGAWHTIVFSSVTHSLAAGSYTFTQTNVSKYGSVTSPTYDTHAAAIPTTFSFKYSATSNGSSSYVTATFSGSNDITFASGVVSQTSSVSGIFGLSEIINSVAASISGKRYWRVKLDLSSPNNISSPRVTQMTIAFAQTVTWQSTVVDCAGVSSFDSLVTTGTIPSGASRTTKIATSASSSGPWSYVTFGSQSLLRYARVQISLTNNGLVSATVSSIVLKWTVTASLESVVIDTGVNPPAGWDVFLAQYTTNGGTVTFQMKSAATSGALPAAVYSTILPSDFPALTAAQFAQWKVTIVSSDNQVPIVDSATVQWLLSSGTSIRPASIFADSRYYVALAPVGQTQNTLMLELDLKGKWRRHGGVNISTMSFFYNSPYIGLSGSGQIRKFLDGFTDAGAPIVFDVRTKSFDFSTKYKDIAEKHKIVGEIIVHAKNTGAALQFMYSTDEGTTWFPFYDNDGNAVVQTTTDGDDFFMRLKPSWAVQNSLEGQRIMYRIYNYDTNQVMVHSFKFTVMARKHAPVRGW
jgi:hypothetical protein